MKSQILKCIHVSNLFDKKIVFKKSIIRCDDLFKDQYFTLN